MSIHEARCECRGGVVFGIYEVLGSGESETVRVRYRGDETEALTCGLPPPIVASTLLGELVTRRARTTTLAMPERPRGGLTSGRA